MSYMYFGYFINWIFLLGYLSYLTWTMVGGDVDGPLSACTLCLCVLATVGDHVIFATNTIIYNNHIFINKLIFILIK